MQTIIVKLDAGKLANPDLDIRYRLPEYVNVSVSEDLVDVCFYVEMEKPFAVGEKMNEICGDAYMNGYNWEAFLECYLETNFPQLLEGLDSDPEAGMYAAYYEDTPENRTKGEQFAGLIALPGGG